MFLLFVFRCHFKFNEHYGKLRPKMRLMRVFSVLFVFCGLVWVEGCFRNNCQTLVQSADNTIEKFCNSHRMIHLTAVAIASKLFQLKDYHLEKKENI